MSIEQEQWLKRLWAERAAERQEKAERRDRARMKRERKMRAQGLKTPGARKRVLHFRWKLTGAGEKLDYRLYLCYGGVTVAAWPTSSEPLLHLVQTKMLGKDDKWNYLSKDQRKIMSMVRRLRKALVSLEDGPRGKSISRQRRNLDVYCKFGVFRVSR